MFIMSKLNCHATDGPPTTGPARPSTANVTRFARRGLIHAPLQCTDFAITR